MIATEGLVFTPIAVGPFLAFLPAGNNFRDMKIIQGPRVNLQVSAVGLLSEMIKQ